MVSGISGVSYGVQDMTDMLQQVFKKLDKNSDGEVTESELKSALQTTDSGVSDSTVSTLFNELDTDGSGSVSLSEFEAAAQQMEAPPPPSGGSGGPSVSEMAQSLFSAADTSGTGTITLSELTAAMEKMQPNSSQSASGDVSTTMDSGGPSVSEMAQSLFSAADTSGTGTITLSELTTAMEKMQPNSNQSASGDVSTTSYDNTGRATQQAFQSLFSLLA